MDIRVTQRKLTYRKVRAGIYSDPDDAVFRYTTEQPHAVYLFFREAWWTFARELLVEGCVDVDGDGEGGVVVRQPEDDEDMVEVVFRSPAGYCAVRFDRDELLDALDDTFELVPYGEESAAFDVDSWIAHELGRAA
jgi:hypothetical protein